MSGGKKRKGKERKEKKRKEEKRKEKVQYSVQCLAQPCVSRTAGIWQLISTQSSPLPLVGVLLGLVPIDLGRPNRPEVWHATIPVVGGSGVAAWGYQVPCGDCDAACFVVLENPEGHCCRQSQQRRYLRHGSVASPTRWRDIGEVAPVAIKLIDFVYGGGCLVGKDEAMRLRSLQSRCAEVVLWENRRRRPASFLVLGNQAQRRAVHVRPAQECSIAELVMYPLLSRQQAMSQELRL
jgi:hypothetical protein